MRVRFLAVLLFIASGPAQMLTAQAPVEEARAFLPAPFDRYFQRRVAELSSAEWQKEITAENWPARQSAMRSQLQRMLGLDPWPERTELKPVITGIVQGDGYVVEKLHFQSRPGLYVGANLYRPSNVTQPLPAILYMCGHSEVIQDGIRMGNKTAYQHHGIWFARNGYVCLVLDTIQRGEFPGEHWGTYNRGRWWWVARGYTPAGVEAWNGIRALDYLETRPEVDRARFGITGISGGGAYSWWIAALDERLKVAVPTAGIATLKNHVLDGAIEGHCDCMYMVNTERWDFDCVAALVAPIPLLIANADKDTIFPLDGVMEIYDRTRALYRTLGQESQIGVHIVEGPHEDMQTLNVGAFEWMNRFLKGTKRKDMIGELARKAHPPQDLKVFTELPPDERVTTADEVFVPAFSAKAEPPSAAEWTQLRDDWMKALREECFRAWPAAPNKVTDSQPSGVVAGGLRLTVVECPSEEPFHPTLWLLHSDKVKPQDIERVVLYVLDDEGWNGFRTLAAAVFPEQFPGVASAGEDEFVSEKLLLDPKWATAFFCPRGAGPTSFASLSLKKRTQLLRRFALLGETLESGQVWDITQAATALRRLPGMAATPLGLHSQKSMAANALYASLFIPNVKQLNLHELTATHRQGPTYLNVLRHLDIPQAVALAAERSTVVLYTDTPEAWRYPQSVAASLGWAAERIQIRGPLPEPALAPPRNR